MANPKLITCHFDPELSVTNQHGESFRFEAKAVLPGTLVLTPTDGPLGIREFNNPHLLDVTFEFQYDGKPRVHRGYLGQFDLWFKNGTAVDTNRPEFSSDAGPVDGLMDLRTDAWYVRSNGSTHTFRVKYIGCSFDMMVSREALLIRCRYYDPTVSSNVTIFYTKPYSDLLFLKAPRLCRNQTGAVEEVLIHDQKFVLID